MIPQKIKIGEIDYSVDFINMDQIDYNSLGRCASKVGKITINSGVARDIQEKTFIHEALHSIIYEYGVDVPEDKEEQLIDQLTPGIYSLVKQIIGNSFPVLNRVK